MQRGRAGIGGAVRERGSLVEDHAVGSAPVGMTVGVAYQESWSGENDGGAGSVRQRIWERNALTSMAGRARCEGSSR
jgi:hypothetical protein